MYALGSAMRINPSCLRITDANGLVTPYALFSANHQSPGVADPARNGSGAEAELGEIVRS